MDPSSQETRDGVKWSSDAVLLLRPDFDGQCMVWAVTKQGHGGKRFSNVVVCPRDWQFPQGRKGVGHLFDDWDSVLDTQVLEYLICQVARNELSDLDL